MKKTLIGVIAGVVLASCSTPVKITGTWSNPKKRAEPCKTILTTALTNEVVPKSILENDMALELEKNGVRVIKSIDEFPPTFIKDSLEKKILMDKVKEKSIDAILTISMIKKESDSRYIPGQCVYTPLMYAHYSHFWGYYYYWRPCVYGPGYYIKDDTYYFETNLYDASTYELIWSAQSRTYYYATLKNISPYFAKAIVLKLQEDGIVRQVTLTLRRSNEKK